MVLRAQWPLGTIAQFFHFVAEEKKDDKKTKAFYDWATTGIPVNRQVALGEMKYSYKKWFIQFRNYVDTLVKLIQ